MGDNPLVSVLVVTYNSSQTVLETLESIKAQTYRNIELIISDDCSSDDTVKICKDWITANKDRFIRTIVLESPVNAGVSANGNRAEKACKGDWVKGIAGDDLLVANCIEKYLEFVSSSPNAKCIFARMISFGGTEEKRLKYDTEVFRYDRITQSKERQLQWLIFERNYIPAPTLFYNRIFFLRNHITNDERIPMLEDRPKWINCLRKGVTFSFMDFVTVKYRLSDNSLSTSAPSLAFRKSYALFYIYYQFFPYLFSKSWKHAIIKLLSAYDFVGGNTFFQKALVNIYKKERKLRGKSESLPTVF